MAAEMELPELPPGYRWVPDTTRDRGDWDIRKDEHRELYAWVKKRGVIYLNPSWPNRHDAKEFDTGATIGQLSQEDAMHILAAHLWLGLSNKE